MSEQNDATSGDDPARKFIPLEAITRIEHEKGRWVVYLNVQSWEPEGDASPITNNWKRINDYATQQEAKVAALWYEKSANRTTRPPTGF